MVQSKSKYYVLGGWLLFFVITNILGVIGDVVVSITAIIDTFNTYDMIIGIRELLPDNFEFALGITLFGELFGLMTILYTVSFLIQVIQRKSAFLKFAQLSVIINIVYVIIANIIPKFIIGSEFVEGGIAMQFAILIGAIIGILLMTLYYCKSIRVRTYMGSDEYMTKAVFAYKNQPPIDMPPKGM